MLSRNGIVLNYAFAGKGFHTIGTLKTNRILYPFGIKKNFNEFVALLSVTHSDFHLATPKNQKYYVYRYEGKFNGIKNKVVEISGKKHSKILKLCVLSLARLSH